MTDLDDDTLHGVNEDTFLYLSKASDALVKTKDNTISFHAPTFYIYGNYLLRELLVLNNNLSEF